MGLFNTGSTPKEMFEKMHEDLVIRLEKYKVYDYISLQLGTGYHEKGFSGRMDHLLRLTEGILPEKNGSFEIQNAKKIFQFEARIKDLEKRLDQSCCIRFHNHSLK